ncbi:MAG: SufD family Fe-S cluster assembly protein [Candidatus Aenigmarchaeota archaeon]|nr:SufD family Fe-S cluster assembly protein [Candidatus Aenigmarchaeota archaeon]
MTEQAVLDFRKSYGEQYGFRTETKSAYETEKGLSEKVVKEISDLKKEPDWLRDFRLKALEHFLKRKMPMWGIADLNQINFDDIVYYVKPTDQEQATSWEELPPEIRKTFDALGIPEAERKFLGGVGAQFESENLYHSLQESLQKQGVIFVDPDTGLNPTDERIKILKLDKAAMERAHKKFREWFGKVVPIMDNKFAALNSAAFSGGSFIYVPPGVEVTMPLQAYFRINRENVGQFERTLIVVDEGSKLHYVEGCFTKGAPIVTSRGIMPIEDVKIGDLVLTHNIKFKRVYHTQVRPHSGKLYRIVYFGDSTQTIEVTEEHPFLAAKKQKDEYKNTEWKPEWIKAEELDKGDYIVIPIDRETESEDEREFLIKIGRGRHGFKTETLRLRTDPDFFRLIGYYLAEGSIVSGHYLHFTFNEKEREYIEEVKELLERYFGKKPYENKPYKHGISIVLNSTAAVRFFESQFGKGAAKKSMPQWVLKEKPEKQKEIVKGFWRGDGSFMMQQYPYGVKRMFRMNTVSEKLARNIRDILLRLNIFASINIQKRGGKRKNMFCIYVGGSFLTAFAEAVEAYPSNEVVVGRQVAFQKLRQINAKSFTHIAEDYAFVPIKEISVREVKDEPVYNFSVEDDESYIANGVVVHNCTAPMYSDEKHSLHSAVVEIVALKDATVRYTTLQNWSNNVYNLVTKRAFAYEGATVEWLDANIGSRVTMKYPSVYMFGKNAKADILSVAFAGKGQIQDAGGKVLHFAPNCTSKIISKSVSKNGGRSSYRGLLKIAKGATNARSVVRCDALLVDEQSKTDTYPYNEIEDDTATVTHEAAVGKIGEDQIFYLMSRGLSEQQALGMIVNGFFEVFAKELPMEYAVEFNRLIQLEMTGSVG